MHLKRSKHASHVVNGFPSARVAAHASIVGTAAAGGRGRYIHDQHAWDGSFDSGGRNSEGVTGAAKEKSLGVRRSVEGVSGGCW